MRALHPDDDAFVFEGHVSGRLHLHVVEVLLVLAAGLAEPDDVDHREDPGPGTVDDLVFHVLEVAPAGAARVDEGRDAVAKAEAVGIDGLVFGGEAPAIGGPVGVRVDVDESGGDVETLDVDRLERLRCRDVGRHGGNLAVLDRHITDGAQVVPAVDDMPPLQEQVVILRGLHGAASWRRTRPGETGRLSSDASQVSSAQPKRTEGLWHVKRGAVGRPPGVVLSRVCATDSKKTDAQLPALFGWASIDRREWYPHHAVPDMCLLVDATLDLIAGVPARTLLLFRVLPIDLQIHPFALRRDLELLVAADVLEIRSDERFGDVPVPEPLTSRLPAADLA